MKYGVYSFCSWTVLLYSLVDSEVRGRAGAAGAGRAVEGGRRREWTDEWWGNWGMPRIEWLTDWIEQLNKEFVEKENKYFHDLWLASGPIANQNSLFASLWKINQRDHTYFQK